MPICGLKLASYAYGKTFHQCGMLRNLDKINEPLDFKSVEDLFYLQNGHGIVLLDDSDDDSYYSESVSLCHDEEYVTNVEVIEEDYESDEANDQLSWGCDAADKYTQGKISFGELNDLMEDSISNDHPRKKICLEKEDTQTDQSLQPENENENTEAAPKKKRKIRRKKSLLREKTRKFNGRS
ncbi:general transcription factor 3C polypeptide 3 [Caerostris extrusa]|uniref:General transcription factor 3C polypeptide 3 n=1 Tax=Caerostris extrusa TaxID=172846 RepID=A0AAV4SU75_CAEEX|nr:general transcription factor 3C polypeptide 3 [Caerostris extrusa]